STLLSSSNKWHSTATHTSSAISATHGYRHRPSIPLSDISTNINTGSVAATTTFSRKCIYVKEVISVNNSAAHLQIASSDAGSASECESGDISSDEYPSQIKVKPFIIDHGQENQHDSTHEMGTLAQLLNHSVPAHVDTSISSQKHESDIRRHEVPNHRMRSSSTSSTPRFEAPLKTRRLSEHLSTTIQRQKTRNEQRHHAYAQLKHLAQRRLNVVAELVTLDEEYEATLAKLLL
ncbi:unnamed protein product, partial [Adineta ricciae]